MTDRPGLKSTYKPSAALQTPLPPGWTEHKAPSGHAYYYHAATKESTYKRPGVPTPEVSQQAAFPQPQLPNLSNPAVANAYLARQNAPARAPERERREQRPKPQPTDKPRSKEAIPGCEPWVLVYTKYGRRFAYHPGKGASYWRIPEKVMGGVLELDRARVAAKAGVGGQGQGMGGDKEAKEAKEPEGPKGAKVEEPARAPAGDEDDSSEYEEVEVTDDEDASDEHRSKRQRTEDAEPALTAEEELAMQLELMAQEQEQEQDPDAYEDESIPEFTEDDARALFTDLLSDHKINPYSPWENLIEQEALVTDPRWTALPTSKARRAVWEGWSKARIRELKEAKAREEKPDPRVEYVAFLEKHASTRLYWPEFKRKFRKEGCMKSFELDDKEREKWYREYVGKLKLPQATLKSDLTALLKSLPLSTLNSSTSPTSLPPQIRADARYAALPPSTRDPLLEAYIQSLSPAPGADEAAAESEAQRARDARRRREAALEERDRIVEARKREEERRGDEARRRLREGEREIRAAGGGATN